MSEKSATNGLVLFIICFFFGYLGIHRFMVGKIGTGIIWFLTLGLFGFGVWVDLIMILIGSFKDKEGKIVKLS